MERRSIERVLRNPFYAGTVIWNGISFDGTQTRLDPARYQSVSSAWMPADALLRAATHQPAATGSPVS